MKKLFFKLHRRLSLILALPVLLWALSGLLHPIMANWMRPDIAHKFLPPTPLRADGSELTPAEAMLDITELHQLNLIQLGETPVYRFITPDQKLHFRDARSGQDLPEATNQLSEQLARAYLADSSSALVSINRIDSFSSNYSYINRLLPVHRVKLDRADGLEVVVDPRTGKLATFDSPSKRLFKKLFSWFHTWSFLGARDSALRITVVLVFSLLALLTGLTGIISLFTLKTKRKDGTKRKLPLRRKIHRHLGALSSVFFLMFSVSGIYHVAAKYNYEDSAQWHSAQSIHTAKLTTHPKEILEHSNSPISSISLAQLNGHAHYRLAIMDREKSSQTLYFNIETNNLVEDGDEQYAIALATEFSGYPTDSVENTEQITNFRKDYGFIFKRLPVVRVNYNDQDYWHYTVDTANAHMAQRTSPAGLIEALSFINLHKFHFLDSISKELRDYVTAIAVILIAFLVMLGSSLLLKKSRPH
ncbi:MAG: PepSY domain-containing protein [Rubritalea sp.]|uniref:PepSY domain-containing protein n=1 Tax=Rubritalea sp. TaxID=2109375 RepID=UPI00324245F9